MPEPEWSPQSISNMTKAGCTYIPNHELEKTFINCIWRVTEFDVRERTEVILPKGTVEIIFNFSDNISYLNSFRPSARTLPAVFLNGINFKPFALHKTGRQCFVGIQLNSVGLKLLSGYSVCEFNDRVYDGDELFPDLSAIMDRLNENPSFQSQVSILRMWIRRHIPGNGDPGATGRAQKLLLTDCCRDVTVKSLSDQICLSDRQLRRFSLDWLGMNTEEFIHYRKYLFCLKQLHDSNKTLTDIGLQAGYYDQSHFIREFKSYTGLTPLQYRRANKGIPGHIYL